MKYIVKYNSKERTVEASTGDVSNPSTLTFSHVDELIVEVDGEVVAQHSAPQDTPAAAPSEPAPTSAGAGGESGERGAAE